MTYFLRRCWLIISLLLLASVAMVGCNFPGFQATPDVFATSAAATVAMRLTQAAGDSQITPPAQPTTPPPPPQPTTPTPTETGLPPTPTNSPTITVTEVPCDRASYVKDVTIPDGTDMAPGDNFTKTWQLKNTGSCTWTSGYSLIFDHGDSMGGPASKQLTAGTVAPGQTVDVSVDLTAPNTPETYKGYWKLRNSSGVVFGVGSSGDVTFWVEIDVVQPPPSVIASGHLEIRQTYHADLDVGANDTPNAADRDMWFQAVSAVEKYLTPENGAKLKKWNAGVPSYEDCASASLSTNKIPLGDISVGTWICYETNLGHIGRFEVEGLTPVSPQILTIDFKTWDTP